MQFWIDRYPILFGLTDGISAYLLGSFVISFWSGWALLARRFHAQTNFVGRRWRWQSTQCRWLCNYHNALTVGVNGQGLFLAPTIRFVPLFHPGLVVPWNEVSVTEQRMLSMSGLQLRLGNELRIPFWSSQDLAQKMAEAARPSFPIETFG